jgi:RimJ/RimL family protein N-acetyltransferase
LAVPESFEGERVIVRWMRDEDAAPLFRVIAEARAHLDPWLRWAESHRTMDDTVAWVRQVRAECIARTSFPMGIFAKDSGAVLGGTGLMPKDWKIPSFEIGYWVRRDSEGKGFVSEAVRLLTTFAFDGLGAQRVQIRCQDTNVRSKRVAERLGFVFEGCLRNAGLDAAGAPCNNLFYAMTPEDWVVVRQRWSGR